VPDPEVDLEVNALTFVRLIDIGLEQSYARIASSA
jgi:hypothetical protein